MIQKIKNLIKLLLFMIKGSVNYYNVAILSEGELLKGKNILVTGGGSGYGFEIAFDN